MAKNEECAYCKKFKQGAYGKKCSFFGRQPVFDNESCSHFDGELPENIQLPTDSLSTNHQAEQPVDKETPIESFVNHSKVCNFFNLPYWLWGIIIILPFRGIIKAFGHGYGELDAQLAFASAFGYFQLAEEIALTIAFWKLKKTSRTHKQLFLLIKMPSINAINVLFWMQLLLVVSSTTIGTLLVFGYEWPLMVILYYFSQLGVAASILVVGLRFNKIEKDNFKITDYFGTWLIGYGIFSFVVFVVGIIFGEIISGLVLWIVIMIISCFLDAIYSYGIIDYSKNVLPKMLLALEEIQKNQVDKHEESVIKKIHDSASIAPIEEPMKKCPYCGEKIKAGAMKCRYCGEWIEKQ